MLLFSLLPLLLAATPSTHALPKVLLFTATAGYRHASIPVAIDVIQRLGNGNITLPHSAVSDRVYSAASQSSARWETVASENDSLFENESYLEQFDAIVFALTSDVEPPGKGTVLSIDGANRLAEYIQRGGGFVGIHSAADTLYDYPWFGRLVGAFFSHHAPLAEVKVKRARGKHPSISHLPDTLSIQEELFHFRTDPRNLPSRATVLLSSAGEDLPLAWCREGRLLDVPSGRQLGGGLDDARGPRGGPGRSFFTSLGHLESTWNRDEFRAHVAGGISWVLEQSVPQHANNNIGVQSATQLSHPSNNRAVLDASIDSATVILIPSRLSFVLAVAASIAFMAV